MFKTILIATLFVALVLPSAQADEKVQALLKKADAYRLSETAMQVETQIIVNKDGRPSKDRRYLVLLR
jgi:hypothetical protein